MADTNQFERALVTLRTTFPETFRLEVNASAFHDVGSLALAHEMSAAMEGMKAQAVDLGYVVTIRFEVEAQRWVYDFKRRKGFMKPVRDADVKEIEMPKRSDPVATLPEPKVEEPKEETSE